MEIRDHKADLCAAAEQVGDTYRKILRVELEQDRLEVLRSDLEGWQPEMGGLSGQLESFAQSGAVHPEDAERFVDFIRPERLRRRLQEGERLTLLYRLRAGEGFRWNCLEVIPDRTGPAGSAILCVKDVHEVLQEAMERENVPSQRESRMAAILKSRFTMINTVDLDSGQCQRTDLTRADGPGDTMVGDYSGYIQKAMDNFVHPEDVESFWARLSLDHLREKAAATERFSEEVCRYRQRGEPLCWIELRIIYSQQDGRMTVNILGKDITSLKQQEDASRQALEDRTNIISSLSTLFFSTYYIDLEQDIFRTVTQQRQVGDVLGSEVNFTSALGIYANNFIHPDDRAEYLRVMSVQNLRERLRWWQPCVALEYRKVSDSDSEDYQWVRATVVLAQTGADDLPKSAVYVAQNVTDSRCCSRDSRALRPETPEHE